MVYFLILQTCRPSACPASISVLPGSLLAFFRNISGLMFYRLSDGPSWEYPPHSSGDEERDVAVRISSGYQWPAQHHASVRQLGATVQESGTRAAELRTERSGTSRRSEEKSTTEAHLTAEDHHPRLDWRELHRQVVEDDLPHRLFLFQRRLLALLHQLSHRMSCFPV